ncbi:alpha/beta hydrolase [Massilia sp. PWRC2]|uniref:alpha/beta hydrolase n=1 Tax=Massilia sp. PWRC2 TaxID=2804626 RepID=UPI003CEE6605
MQPCLNGAPSRGGRYRVAGGATLDIYPFFGAAHGTVDIAPEVFSEQLNNSRRLRIYYPPSYRENSAKRYPVLYMHDGQNLFDPITAAYGVAWDLAASLDSLIATGQMEEIIVVGIDNSAARLAEYTPCCDPRHGGGQLSAYEAFVADTVKPLIDRTRRTLPGRQHTALMGSSLGGLAALAIARHRPAQFSMAAGLSSSFWWAGQAMIKDPPGPARASLPQRFYIDAGTVDDGLDDTKAMHDALLAQGYTDGRDLLLYEAPGGRHNEASWAARVQRPLLWFFPWQADQEIRAARPAGVCRHKARSYLYEVTSTKLHNGAAAASCGRAMPAPPRRGRRQPGAAPASMAAPPRCPAAPRHRHRCGPPSGSSAGC